MVDEISAVENELRLISMPGRILYETPHAQHTNKRTFTHQRYYRIVRPPDEGGQGEKKRD